ncbi:MAG: DUF6785 family protein [Candidatus Bathyarchaeia archaeon]
MSQIEEKKAPALSLTTWITTLIIGIIVFIVSYTTRTVCIGKWWLVNGWWVPFIYVILIIEVLKRIKPGFKVSPLQLLLLIIPMFMVGGKAWTASYTGEVNLIDTIVTFFTSFNMMPLNVAALADYYKRMTLPSWFMINDPHIAEIVNRGLAPGESIPWDAWAGPILSWSIILIMTILLHIFTAYLFTGPQWVKKERLIFPQAVPTIYLVNTYTSTYSPEGKSMLFNLGNPQVKAFWIAVIVGFILGLPYYITQLFAPWWPITGFGIGFYNWDLGSAIHPILPGAHFGGMLSLIIVFAFILMPFEASITMIYTWLIFGVIYPVVVNMFALAPPSGPSSPWGPPYQWSDPFPFSAWGYGWLPGLAIFYLWIGRDQLKTVINTVLGKTGSPDVEEKTMIRWAFIGWIVSFILLLLIFSAVGVPVLVVFFFLIIYLLWSISSARGQSEYAYWSLGECAFYMPWLVLPAGALIGSWAIAASQENLSLLAFGVMAASYMTCLSFNNTPPGLGGFTIIYKIAHDTGADLKETLKWLISFFVISIPIYLTYSVWINHHMGFANLAESFQSAIPFNAPGAALDYGVRALSVPGGMSFEKYSMWAILGTISAIIVMGIKYAVPRIPFHPIAFLSYINIGPYMWINAVIGFAVKYILYRTLGPKRTAEYIIPLMSGLFIGLGIMYIVAGIYVWIAAGLPSLQTYWR